MRVNKKSVDDDIINGLSEDIKDRERRDSLLLPQFFYSYKLIPKSQEPK
jgi:hypothetical protein